MGNQICSSGRSRDSEDRDEMLRRTRELVDWLKAVGEYRLATGLERIEDGPGKITG